MKKTILCFMVIVCAVMSTTAFALTNPDWGSLLDQREAMVTEPELELFTEGSLASAWYYGQKLEPRSGVYIGMIAESSGLYQPLGSYLTYIEGMNQDDLYYPANEMIANDPVVGMIGWTVYDLDTVDYDHIWSVLETLNGYGKPLFVRFANEMNESVLGDNPEQYIEVFRRVADMVHAFPNLATVWAPIDLGALNKPLELYYPGDEYVDWVGVSNYSIKYFLGNKDTTWKDSVYFMTGDFAWATNRMKPLIDFMEKNGINKPVMISEGGVPTGTIHDDDLEWWSAPRLRNFMWSVIMKYPQVKMINYFNKHMGNESNHYDLDDYPFAVDIFNEAAHSGAYITRYGKDPDFVFQPAYIGETLVAKDGIVPLYALAHIPHADEIWVNYSVDGVWYHSSNQIPYRCNLAINDLADGEHTISIWTGDESKSYVFYKRGNAIRFGGEPEYVEPELPVLTQVNVTVNGKSLATDSPFWLDGDVTLAPCRALSESVGFTVNWDEAGETAIITKGQTKISIPLGSDRMTVDGTEQVLSLPAQLIDDTLYLPLRNICEALGCRIKWDDATQTVQISA